MKPLILTGHTSAMREIADLCLPSVKAWAAKHGCECVVLDDGFFPNQYGHPSFQKLRWIDHFAFSDPPAEQPVIWLDADVLITNDLVDACSLLPTPPDFLRVSRDYRDDGRPPHLAWSAGVMAWRPTQEAFEWLGEALKDEHAKWNGLWDQDALQRCQPSEGVCLSPPRMLNAVAPSNPYADDAAKWQPGDLLCHFTGFLIDQRAAVIRDFIAQL